MPYKPYAGTPGAQANPQAKNGNAMAAKELQMGQDVMMQEMVTGNAEALAAAAGQAGKKFFPKKFAGVAKPKPVSAAVRKRRMNFRLRKVLTPKSPLMVLNEIVGGVTYDFVDNPPQMMTPGIPQPHLFTAQCTVEGETFSGTGPSKQIAKNICAEHVIQFVVSKKCSENKDKVGTLGENGKPVMEDDTPWLQLASLAMFKLFNDWQAQGFVIPSDLLKSPGESGLGAATPGNGNGNGAPAGSGDVLMTSVAPKKPKIEKKLPENPTERHPVQLLNEMQGAITYSVVGSSGVTPNIIFTLGCDIEGKQYTGVGKNKKDAKKHCAMEALKALYNVQYPNTLTSESA